MNAIQWTSLAGGLESTAGISRYFTVDTSPHHNNVAVTATAGWNHINKFQTTNNAGASWSAVSGKVDLDDQP